MPEDDLIINSEGIYDRDIEEIPRMYTARLMHLAQAPNTDAFFRRRAIEELQVRLKRGEDIYRGFGFLRPEKPWYSEAGEYLHDIASDVMGVNGLIDNLTGNTGYHHLKNAAAVATALASPVVGKYREYKDRFFPSPNEPRINVSKLHQDDSRNWQWNYSQRENQSPIFDETQDKTSDDLYAKFKSKIG